VTVALAPCPGCGRHVRLDERACPFCGVAIAALAAAPTTTRRLTRAAAFAFSASLSTAALLGCGGTADSGIPATDSGSGGGGADTGTTGKDATPDIGSPGPMYGAAFVDAGTDGAKDAAADGSKDDGGGMVLYGAPPYGIPPMDSGKD
jgi:hypothetical protein